MIFSQILLLIGKINKTILLKVTSSMNENVFFGVKDLAGYTYNYQFTKILSSKTIELSTRISKLGGVNIKSNSLESIF